MLYESDFNYFQPAVLRNHPKKSLKRKKHKKINRNFIVSYWKYFCQRASMHGFRYLTDDDLTTFEKALWSIVLFAAIFGTFYVSILLSERFNSNNLATVVESTVFPVYQIPFPAITICNQNRINWARIDEAEERFIPNASHSNRELFRRFVASFENFEFGNFDEFEKFENVSLNSLDHINISALAKVMAFRCEELFEGLCWWRNRELPCCDIFMLQKSEYGYCYAFNSVVNDEGKQMAKKDSNWPWRTSTAGDWSALRATIRLNGTTKRPGNEEPSGILVIVHSPVEWPSTGLFVPLGTASTVLLKPKVSYASDETRSIRPEIRECVFADETKKTNYKSLPGFEYLMLNCISNCRQMYTVKYCNCTVEMFFPPGNNTACRASDFHCLSEHDRIFNYEKLTEEEEFINSTGEGMVCNCLHECYSIDYQIEISPFSLAEDEDSTNRTYLQVYYQRNTIMKYRTNVVFGWLDLLVAFGGIAGLFLGSSLISGFELLYYMTIGLGVFLNNKVWQIPPRMTTDNSKCRWANTPQKIKNRNQIKKQIEWIDGISVKKY